MRILILWTHATSYLIAGIDSLIENGHEVTLVSFHPSLQYPHVISKYEEQLYRKSVEEVSSDFESELLLICGWHIKEYRKLTRQFRKSHRVLYIDNQFRDSWRQRLFKIFGSSIFLKYHFDAAFVPGFRQKIYLEYLGFPTHAIHLGGLTYDNRIFYKRQKSHNLNQFIFVGRITHKKGVMELLEGFKIFRSKTLNLESRLIIIGPKDSNIELTPNPEPGVSYLGFKAPWEVAEHLAESEFFVLPSVFEPWGVAALEAAAMGLSLLLTENVGSSDELLFEGKNGITIKLPNPQQISDAMLEITSWEFPKRMTARKLSIENAKSFGPAEWARKLVETIET